MSLEWRKSKYDEWIATVPYQEDNGNEGTYTLIAAPRPFYCDRGDWLMYVDEQCSKWRTVDHQDGLPRYFFGDEEAVKEQFLRWARKRKGVKLDTNEEEAAA
jgi:hypothetical protein